MKLGFTGKYASGKTDACKFLQGKGFAFRSLSDIIREDLKELGEEPVRERMIEYGNELREQHGPGVLGEKTVERIEEGDVVIDSIRSPHEVKELRQMDDFILIGIDAPIEVRFERILERDRPGDPNTLDELKRLEAKENSDDDNAQQLDATFEMSDIIIENDGTLEEFHENLNKLLEGLR